MLHVMRARLAREKSIRTPTGDFSTTGRRAARATKLKATQIKPLLHLEVDWIEKLIVN